jgi:CHAT domain-containing protein
VHYFPALILSALLVQGGNPGPPATYLEFSAQPLARMEGETYADAVRYLQNGDRISAMNLINRDPIMSRLALIRMLRDFATSPLVREFAELFPLSSDSEIEIPFMEMQRNIAPGLQLPFVAWIEMVTRSQFLVVHHVEEPTLADDLVKAAEFFKSHGFPIGEALSLRMLAQTYSYDLASFDRSQQLYKQALVTYESAGSVRGQVLSLTGLAGVYREASDRQRRQQSLTDALQRARATGDDVAEFHFIAMRGNQDQLRETWPTLERHPGLQWLKYRWISGLVASEAKYKETYEAMLAQETDRVVAVKADWYLFNVLHGRDTAKAIEASERAIRRAAEMPFDMAAYDDSLFGSALPEMLSEKAFAEFDLFRPDRAEATLLSALDVWRSEGKPGFLTGESGVLKALAQAYELQGDIPKAIEAIKESLSLADRFGAHEELGRIYGLIGNIQYAEEEYRKASRMRTPQVNPSLANLAKLHLQLGEYAKALKDLEDMDPEFERFPKSDEVRSRYRPRLLSLALAWLGIGDLDKAMDYARDLETKPLAGPPDVGVLGMVLIEKKDYAAAEKYFKNRIDSSSKGPEPKEADAHKNLGRIYRIQNRRSDAASHLTKAQELYHAMFSPSDELDVLIELGRLSAQSGRGSDARQYFDQGLTIARETHSPQGEWSARAALAELEAADGHTSAAIEQLSFAVGAVETVASGLNTDLTKPTFIQNTIAIYDQLIGLLGNSHAEDAFEYAERRRAQSFIEGAQKQGLTQVSASDSDLLRKKNDAEARLTGKQKALMEQLSRPPAERSVEFIEALRGELEDVRFEHLELLRRIQDEQPVEALRGGLVRSVTVADVRRDVLQPRDALVEYVVTDRAVFAVLVTTSQCRLIQLSATRKALTDQVQRLLQPFGRLRSGQVDLLHMIYDVPLAYQLYSELIAPLERYIGNVRRLIIIPDDVLHYLPFESLTRTSSVGQRQVGVIYSEYQQVDWLVNRYAVVYAISATSLHPRFRPERPEPQSLLAFGNPKTIGSQTNDAKLRSFLADASMPPLGPLPQSAREVATIAQLLHGRLQTSVLTGEEARESAFSERAGSAGYLHFAVHALIDEQQPYYSALVLSPDQESDGLLQAYEIMPMHLNARLVTLSACETALGRLYKGEGLLGLRRAFLMAGAEAVVVSFWSIDDSTADFMESFYTNISRGQPVPDALRNTKLRYLKRTMAAGPLQISLSHPFFWAAFAVNSTRVK